MRQNLQSTDLTSFDGRLLKAGSRLNFLSSEKNKTLTELRCNLALNLLKFSFIPLVRGEIWLIKGNFLNITLLDFCEAISCVQLGKNKTHKNSLGQKKTS